MGHRGGALRRDPSGILVGCPQDDNLLLMAAPRGACEDPGVRIVAVVRVGYEGGGWHGRPETRNTKVGGHANMGREEIIGLARAVAGRQGLDPALVCAVCEQESGWNSWAIRYEPAFYRHYLQPMIAKGALHDETETRARAFSWGLMQVMGQTARENGYGGHLAGLCDPAAGIEVGCRVLTGKLAEAQGDVERGLLLWNGGANSSYPAEVLARRGKYTG